MTNNKNFNNPLHKLKKEYGDEIYNTVGEYQKQYGFEIGTGNHATWNNEADAFKHAFMQADLARKWGSFAAEQAGNYHEWEGNKHMGQPQGEENMDQWNNRQGREIAREIKEQYFPNKDYEKHLGKDKNWDDLIAKKVMERMNEGKLITNPNDKRQYKEKKPWFAGKNFSTGQAAPIDANGKFDDSEGHWVTMNGAHVFIKD